MQKWGAGLPRKKLGTNSIDSASKLEKKISPHLEKCVWHSLKILDIV